MRKVKKNGKTIGEEPKKKSRKSRSLIDSTCCSAEEAEHLQYVLANTHHISLTLLQTHAPQNLWRLLMKSYHDNQLHRYGHHVVVTLAQVVEKALCLINMVQFIPKKFFGSLVCV
jgi:hypothetical protein